MYIVYTLILKGFGSYTEIMDLKVNEVLDMYDFLSFNNEIELQQWNK